MLHVQLVGLGAGPGGGLLPSYAPDSPTSSTSSGPQYPVYPSSGNAIKDLHIALAALARITGGQFGYFIVGRTRSAFTRGSVRNAPNVVTVQTVQAVLTALPLLTGTGKYKIKDSDARRLVSRATGSGSGAVSDLKKNAKQYYEAIRFYLKSRWPADFALQVPAAPSGNSFVFPGSNLFPGSNQQSGGGADGGDSGGSTDQGTTQQDQGAGAGAGAGAGTDAGAGAGAGTDAGAGAGAGTDQGALPGTQQSSITMEPKEEQRPPVEPMAPVEIPTSMTRATDFFRQNKREITYGLAAVGIAAIALRLFR